MLFETQRQIPKVLHRFDEIYLGTVHNLKPYEECLSMTRQMSENYLSQLFVENNFSGIFPVHTFFVHFENSTSKPLLRDTAIVGTH